MVFVVVEFCELFEVVAEAAWFPQLGLSASIAGQSNTLENLFSTPNLIWAVGGSLSQTIFDGGVREANKKQAMASYDASVANYKQSVLVAFGQVEDALTTVQNLKSASQMQAQKLQLSQEIFTISKNQYNAGIINYLSTINAQTNLFNDMLTDTQLKGRLIVAHIALIGSLGGGWEFSKEKKI